MQTIYRGYTQRLTRHIYVDNALTDPTALTVTIKNEATGEALVADSVTFNELSVLGNKIDTGKFYAEINPDSDETLGIYLVYWRVTYDSETWTEGPYVMEIRGEDEVPSTSDNYVSLDEIASIDRRILTLDSPLNILREGERASRILDSELDPRFRVPVQKRTDSDKYDQVIIQAASLLTAARILGINGYAERAEIVYNDYQETVDRINNGQYRLWEEITESEVGFAPPVPTLDSASSNIELEVNPECRYSGVYHKLFVVEIQTGGDIETATWRFSDDGGATWEESDIETSAEWYAPTNGDGLEVRFFRRGSSGTLTSGDKWTIEARPLSSQISGSSRGPKFRKLRI